ncbi:MAG: hypothetical protein ACJA0N_001400 [Pseudohongiellaceae bacterium]|jgi:hypothetical protein
MYSKTVCNSNLITLILSLLVFWGISTFAIASVTDSDTEISPDATHKHSNTPEPHSDQNPEPHSVPTLGPNFTDINLRPYKAIYKADIKGLSATLTRSLDHRGDGLWQLQNDASVFFSTIKERCLLQITPQGIESLNYHYKNPLSSKRNSSLKFDWANNNVQDSHNKGTILNLKNNSYDKLSFQLQLRMDLIQQGQHFKSKQYHVVDKDRFKTYRVERVSEELIVTPAGTFKAIKLKQYRPGKNKHTFIWMAKDWQYIILRLERFKKGNREHSLELLEMKINGKAINTTKQ